MSEFTFMETWSDARQLGCKGYPTNFIQSWQNTTNMIKLQQCIAQNWPTKTFCLWSREATDSKGKSVTLPWLWHHSCFPLPENCQRLPLFIISMRSQTIWTLAQTINIATLAENRKSKSRPTTNLNTAVVSSRETAGGQSRCWARLWSRTPSLLFVPVWDPQMHQLGNFKGCFASRISVLAEIGILPFSSVNWSKSCNNEIPEIANLPLTQLLKLKFSISCHLYELELSANLPH